MLTDDRGNAVLEFAVAFPIFLALILGMINLAVILANDIAASAAARDAGRTVAVTGDASAARARGIKILEEQTVGAAETNVDVGALKEDRVPVTASCRSPVLAPGFAGLVGGNFWDNYIDQQKKTTYYVEYRHRTEPPSFEPRCVHCSCWGWGACD